MTPIRSALRGYIIATLATALVVAVGGYFLGDAAPVLFFIVPVVAAWRGGLLAGAFAIVICVLAGAFFFLNVYDSGDRTLILLFIVAAGLAIWLVESLHVARRNVEERQRQLEREAAERKEMERALHDADRRKDEFLATLAHELRNPLAPLANSLELWRFVESDPTELAALRKIMEGQVAQMTRLIDDLLDISRITRGKIDLRTERVDLNTLVSVAVETIRPMIQSHRQELSVVLPSEPVMVEGDAARLTQVFGNILHNASKFTGTNGVIWVHVERQAEKVQVSIRDNGPGIPPHMLSDIFEMFRQVDQTLQRANGGLGIGLSLAKKLIEVHGGSIEAKSDGAGRGSNFTITLPLASPQPEGAAEDSPRPAAADEPVGLHKILVVDDIHSCAQTLALMLQSIGQETTVARDGSSAIETVLTHRPDVVFLDIAMPGMDGYEVARRLRAQDDLKGMTLVAVTGFGQNEDRRLAYAAGFDHHITKPATLNGLKSLLATVPVRPRSAEPQTVGVDCAPSPH
jgi:signal transduction histidine kinase/ActR/RegA family two-component response regulator